MPNFTTEVFIKWQKDIDNAILGEIKEKAEIEKEISALQGKLDQLNKLLDYPTEKGGEQNAR